MGRGNKRIGDIPKVVHVCCFVLGVANLLFPHRIISNSIVNIFLSAGLFLLIGAPYLLWAILVESRDYDKCLKEVYSNSVYTMWFVRIFMMVFLSVIYVIAPFIAAVIAVNLVGWIYSIFQKI